MSEKTIIYSPEGAGYGSNGLDPNLWASLMNNGGMGGGIVLPPGYTRLQYATKNGYIAYINTGVIPEYDDVIQIDVKTNTDESTFGSDNFVHHLGFWRIFMDKGIDMQDLINNVWKSYRYADGVFTEPLQNPSKSIVRGELICHEPMFLFRRVTMNYTTITSIAYYKDIKPDGSGCELYPAIRDADGVVGFYDIINDNFLVSKKDTLTAGPIYTGEPLYDEPE